MNLYANDKSTLFSIAPFGSFENKPGLYPGNFKIEACFDDSKPFRLVIGASNHIISIGGRKEPIMVTQPSFEVAASVVRDFLDGQMFASPEAHPGICWVQGDVSLSKFILEHKDLYEEMKLAQKRWFVLLVQKTTDDWNRYHHSRVVSDPARFAVRALGIDPPEWMTMEHTALSFETCPACGTKNDRQNAVCTNCRCILNDEKYKKLSFAK